MTCRGKFIISILLNANHADVQLGDNLSSFKEFSKQFDPAVSDLNLLCVKREPLCVLGEIWYV